MATAIRGSCLCGDIRFEIDGKFGAAGQCHCSKCRKVSGTDGNAVFYAPAASFRWLAGEDLIVARQSHRAVFIPSVPYGGLRHRRFRARG